MRNNFMEAVTNLSKRGDQSGAYVSTVFNSFHGVERSIDESFGRLVYGFFNNKLRMLDWFALVALL